MGGYSFEAVLVKPEGVGTWTFLGIPIEVSAMFGSKGQVKVKGTINGYPFPAQPFLRVMVAITWWWAKTFAIISRLPKEIQS